MNILEQLVQGVREALAWRQQSMPILELGKLAESAPPVRDFHAALSEGAGVALIAEIKHASPSAGTFVTDFDPLGLAQIYQANGARAISVVTEEKRFKGSLDILSAVSETVELPVMLKDFVVDEYQIIEARAVGADAVLLIGELLDDATLERFLDLTHRLGMSALVEAFRPDVLERVCRSSARIVGINNRDLATFQTSIDTTRTHAEMVPKEKVLVSESGIRTADDVRRLAESGVRAVLVGEALVRASDIAANVRELADVCSNL